jgi:hypothetical protein
MEVMHERGYVYSKSKMKVVMSDGAEVAKTRISLL